MIYYISNRILDFFLELPIGAPSLSNRISRRNSRVCRCSIYLFVLQILDQDMVQIANLLPPPHLRFLLLVHAWRFFLIMWLPRGFFCWCDYRSFLHRATIGGLGWLQMIVVSHNSEPQCGAGIPLVYIDNFMPIWCGTLFYGILCGSNSCRMCLEPHRPLFESYGRKYTWIILLHSNTNVSRSRFHRAGCNLWQCQFQCVTWSECISTVCRMAVYSVPSWETAIVWNQPLKESWLTICSKRPERHIKKMDRSFLLRILSQTLFTGLCFGGK